MTSQDQADDPLVELLATAREQLRWQKAAVIPVLKQGLLEVLETTELRRAYELCDGSNTFREIAGAVGVSVATIGNWTRRWREAGLAYEDTGGHVRHLVGLEALGVPVEVRDETSSRRPRP